MPAPYDNPYDTPEWGDAPPLNGPPAGPRKQTREEMVLGGMQDPAQREALGSGIAQLQQMLGGAYNPRMASALNIGLRNGRSIPEILRMFQDQANGNAYANFSANHDGGTAIQNLLSQFGPVQPQNRPPVLTRDPNERPIVEYGPNPSVPVGGGGRGGPIFTPVGGGPVPHYAPGPRVPVGPGGRGGPVFTSQGDGPVPHYAPPGTYPTGGGGLPIDNPGLVPPPKPGGPPPGGGGVGPGGQPIGGGPRKIGIDPGHGGGSNMTQQQPQPQTITMRYDYRQPNSGQSQQQSRSSQPQQGQGQNNYNRASGQTNQWNQQQQFAAQRPFEQNAPNRTSPTQEANKMNQGYQGWRGNGQVSRY